MEITLDPTTTIPGHKYSTEFFAHHNSGSYQSALRVLPTILQLSKANRVIDVGCGIGTWAKACLDLGVETVVGLDGAYVNRTQLLIPEDCFFAVDFNSTDGDVSSKAAYAEKFDLAMSLEVAEHLDVGSAVCFIETLTRLSDTILFSAAIPEQGGTGHINEQWPSYWARIFETFGYAAFDVVRPVIWADDMVEYWYRQNTLLYAKKGRLDATYKAAEISSLDVVHPELYRRKSMMYKSLSAEVQARTFDVLDAS